jgi:hypothetical protein
MGHGEPEAMSDGRRTAFYFHSTVLNGLQVSGQLGGRNRRNWPLLSL